MAVVLLVVDWICLMQGKRMRRMVEFSRDHGFSVVIEFSERIEMDGWFVI